MSTIKRIASLLQVLGFLGCVVALPSELLATSGDISTNTTWSGTVNVTGDVRVLSGVTLTIVAGTQISINPASSTDISAIPAQMNGKVDICIVGHLQVNGTCDSHVAFYSNDGSPGGDDWYQLVVSSNGSAAINHAELRNCEYGLAISTGGVVSVSESEFADNDDDDITIGGTPASVSISACTFDVEEGAGIKVSTSAPVTIAGCTIAGTSSSSNGVEASSSAVVDLRSNNIDGFDNGGNTGCGVFLQGNSSASLYDNHIVGCDNGIRVVAGGGSQASALIGAEDDGNEIESCAVGISVETTGPGSCPAYTPTALIRYNWIHGNDIGIKTVKTASGVDAGTNGDYGYNKIEGSTSYAISNTSSCTPTQTVTARGNNWGRDGSNNCIAAVTSGSVDANEIWCPGSGEPGGCHSCPQGSSGAQEVPKRTRQNPTMLTSVAPNPFNPETTIGFELGASLQPEIAIYNVTGQLVRIERMGPQPAGHHTWVWDGRDRNGSSVGSGVYFVVLKAGVVTDVRKAVLLK